MRLQICTLPSLILFKLSVARALLRNDMVRVAGSKTDVATGARYCPGCMHAYNAELTRHAQHLVSRVACRGWPQLQEHGITKTPALHTRRHLVRKRQLIIIHLTPALDVWFYGTAV